MATKKPCIKLTFPRGKDFVEEYTDYETIADMEQIARHCEFAAKRMRDKIKQRQEEESK